MLDLCIPVPADCLGLAGEGGRDAVVFHCQIHRLPSSQDPRLPHLHWAPKNLGAEPAIVVWGHYLGFPRAGKGNGWYLRQRCCQQREMQAQQLLLAQGLLYSSTLYLQCLQGQGWLLPRPWPSLPAGSAFACPLCLLGQGGTGRAESGCACVPG